MKENRLEYMDVAKGIGILAIIIGHANSMFEKWVFPFHVPLFLLYLDILSILRNP